MIGVGLISACVISLYVEKSGKYKPTFIFCSVLAIGSSFGFMFSMYYLDRNFIVLLIMAIMMGSSLTPLIPLSFDFGCEIVFPVG